MFLSGIFIGLSWVTVSCLCFRSAGLRLHGLDVAECWLLVFHPDPNPNLAGVLIWFSFQVGCRFTVTSIFCVSVNVLPLRLGPDDEDVIGGAILSLSIGYYWIY